MAGRIRLGRRGGRVVVVMATAAYVAGLAIAGRSSPFQHDLQLLPGRERREQVVPLEHEPGVF